MADDGKNHLSAGEKHTSMRAVDHRNGVQSSMLIYKLLKHSPFVVPCLRPLINLGSYDMDEVT